MATTVDVSGLTQTVGKISRRGAIKAEPEVDPLWNCTQWS